MFDWLESELRMKNGELKPCLPWGEKGLQFSNAAPGVNSPQGWPPDESEKKQPLTADSPASQEPALPGE